MVSSMSSTANMTRCPPRGLGGRFCRSALDTAGLWYLVNSNVLWPSGCTHRDAAPDAVKTKGLVRPGPSIWALAFQFHAQHSEELNGRVQVVDDSDVVHSLNGRWSLGLGFRTAVPRDRRSATRSRSIFPAHVPQTKTPMSSGTASTAERLRGRDALGECMKHMGLPSRRCSRCPDRRHAPPPRPPAVLAEQGGRVPEPGHGLSGTGALRVRRTSPCLTCDQIVTYFGARGLGI